MVFSSFHTTAQAQVKPVLTMSQARALALRNSTKIEQLENHKDREKAFHDIVVSVKENSFRRDTLLSGNDLNALTQAIAGKKALEELKKTHISLDT